MTEAHDICGRIEPRAMIGKEPECLEVEKSIIHREGDTYVITFPKTGTTLIQFICHLIRTNADERAIAFDDIHQVCPHTSSAWYIHQDLNAEQPASPRLFKSHRMLQQVAPFAKGVKFIATIRDPFTTLVSCYHHRKKQGRLPAPPGGNPPTLAEFALSRTWLESLVEGCVTNIWDHILTFWNCRNASNFLLIPFEDLTSDRERWVPVIAEFMHVPCPPELVVKVAQMASLENMLTLVDKFDESWVMRRREELNLSHPTIRSASAKVTKGHDSVSKEADASLIEVHNRLWAEKMEPQTGFKSYDEMRRALVAMYDKSLSIGEQR